MKRTAEFVLGLIGGILGILAALSGVFFGAVATALQVDGGGAVSTASWVAVALSILGIIGAAMIKSKTGLASIFLLIAGIGGFICISALYILPGVLLLIAGIMGLVRKDKSAAGA
jgi:hypothetical protein